MSSAIKFNIQLLVKNVDGSFVGLYVCMFVNRSRYRVHGVPVRDLGSEKSKV
jgi:hypothetical protein